MAGPPSLRAEKQQCSRFTAIRLKYVLRSWLISSRTSVRSPGRLSLHADVAGSAALAWLGRNGGLQFELRGRGVELRRRRLQMGKGLGLGQRGLELRLRVWRRELGASSGCGGIVTRASRARQQLGERFHVNRATGHLSRADTKGDDGERKTSLCEQQALPLPWSLCCPCGCFAGSLQQDLIWG